MKFQSLFLAGIGLIITLQAQAQFPGWQQAVAYTMDIDVDAASHSYDGDMSVMPWIGFRSICSSTPFSPAV